eukprot:c28683_g3_i1 orf=411-3836(+)
MKNILRKLHIGGNQDETSEGSKYSSLRSQEGTGVNMRNRMSFLESNSTTGDSKHPSSLSGWLTMVARHTLQTASAGQNANQAASGESPKHQMESTVEGSGESNTETVSGAYTFSPDAVNEGVNIITSGEPMMDTGTESSVDEQGDYLSLSLDEECQVQLAMVLSANEDPEAVQIEAVKQISLGSHPSHPSSSAEVMAYQYWNFNVLNYDDRVLDGFYDVYGVVSCPTSESVMPSLMDLQGTPVSDNIVWEAVLVNRATDPDLVNLERRTLSLVVDNRAGTMVTFRSYLVQKIADLVARHMGGPVVDADDVLKQWRTFSEELRSSLGNIVLPLGRLRKGLARHRALLFKVLADAGGIPCRLVKGRHYTGSEEGAVNIINLDDDREFIIDLMGAPGMLIPSDAIGLSSFGARVEEMDENGKVESTGILGTPDSSMHMKKAFSEGPCATAYSCNIQDVHHNETSAEESKAEEPKPVERYLSEPAELIEMGKVPVRIAVNKSSYLVAHGRSPSWTEGIGAPTMHDMKVKDVSQYMMDAAKENPMLAQKLHDVLLESGVVAPPDLFTDISPKQLQAQATDEKKIIEEKEDTKETREISTSQELRENKDRKVTKENAVRQEEDGNVGPSSCLDSSPKQSSEPEKDFTDGLQKLNSVEGLGERRPLEPSQLSSSPTSSDVTSHPKPSPIFKPLDLITPAASALTVIQESLPPQIIKRVPVAAAAAATAAVVASSMVVAAAKSDIGADPTLEVPVAAAATATAAVVVATSAAVGKKLDFNINAPVACPEENEKNVAQENDGKLEVVQQDSRLEDTDAGRSPASSGKREDPIADFLAEEEKVSDKSSSSVSWKFDPVLDDVAEWEIPWEDIDKGDRIGLGSYGEVYRGEWHGTEVAVKKFLDQDISGDALEEFRSEVRIMRRLRHPNVVLFMGAVTRSPNLSIVTEFLPRGSLYRLIHRPNSQLDDERRRMRMALDVAKGMNYLHSSTPVIVHRDLKSPNLLVDKNWVVKVCDFGLSRMKHNTFLSSKSTAGTPEWMAPEVLRNEPSNEKSDVYSFGVILWELATLQQPWSWLNPMQVVGAVGFQHRRLDIPDDVDPIVSKIIRQCWESDPYLRPSFTEIIATLKPLQRSTITLRTTETSRPSILVNRPP